MFFLDSYCGDLYPIIKIIKIVVNLIRFGVPIALILFITIDLVKAVIAGSEEDMKKNQGVIIKRVIYAIAVYLVVTGVMFLMDIVADSGTKDLSDNPLDVKSWKACWNCKSKSECGTVEPEGRGICCAKTENNKETYTWLESAKSCPSEYGRAVNKTEDKCHGYTVNVEGICCKKTTDHKVEFTWTPNTEACPEGYDVDKSRKKDSCNGSYYQ